MSRTVRIGDSIVGKVGVGSRRLVTCRTGEFLNLCYVAWPHEAHVDLQPRPIRPSVRRDQGRCRRYANRRETLSQHW